LRITKLIIIGIIITSSLNAKMKFEITEGSSKIHLPYQYNDNGQCDKMIERQAYVSCYSYENKIPLFVAYKLTKESVSPSLKRPSRFFYDNTIPKEYRSLVSHYKRSGKDRGHMMENASADFNKQAQLETFILSNIVPQNSKLNRGAWAFLEGYTRKLAKIHGTIYVITGAIPSKDNFLKKGHVNIPEYMYKLIYIPSKDRTISIVVRNDRGIKKSDILKEPYKTTQEKIASASGISFNFKSLTSEDMNNNVNIVVNNYKETGQKSHKKQKKINYKDINYKDMYYKLKKHW